MPPGSGRRIGQNAHGPRQGACWGPVGAATGGYQLDLGRLLSQEGSPFNSIGWDDLGNQLADLASQF
ncbi:MULTISPECIES: hypothetical protein [unclassified Mycobacterium]|uniref:hypothetical protein n=1 Tax=unclassified Mycobacterium TaxID=2642494 RepID=UPI000406BE65|nr:MULTISPECIES: hypothetical protein [unclassified Mycobacterium]